MTTHQSCEWQVDGTLTGTAHACSTGDEQPCFPLDYAVRPINFHGLRAETLSNERNISLVQHHRALLFATFQRHSALLFSAFWLVALPAPVTADVPA